MNEETTQQLIATTERLAAAAEALSEAAGRLETQHRELGTQQQALDDKIGRIVAAIEDQGATFSFTDLKERVAQLERENAELKANASRISANSARKTLPPLVTALLSKSGAESADKIDAATLDKTLASLSVEQRIAVKAQMARAGIIE